MAVVEVLGLMVAVEIGVAPKMTSVLFECLLPFAVYGPWRHWSARLFVPLCECPGAANGTLVCVCVPGTIKVRYIFHN